MPLKRSDKWVSGLRPTKEVGSNPKDELGMLKVPLGLVSPVASALQALCMQDGAEKYGPYNYRVSKVQALIYLEAAKRHIDALLDGEDFDALTGKPHIGYALATLQIYADAWINNYLIDNRPIAGKTGLLHTAFTRKPGEPELTPAEIQERILTIVSTPIPSGGSNEASSTESLFNSINQHPTRVNNYARRGRSTKLGNKPRRKSGRGSN